MGSSLTKKDLTADKSLPWTEKLKDLALTNTEEKLEATNRIFKSSETIKISSLLFSICLLLIELKDLSIQDFHQKRLALSFFRIYKASYEHKSKGSIVSLDNLPLDLKITKKIFEEMVNKWWNDSKEINKIFIIPMKLNLTVLSIATYVQNNPLELNNRFIIYGGQPLDTSQKTSSLNIIIGRKASNHQPNIPFSEEEPYISRNQCIIGFACPSDFYMIDSSKTINTSFLIPAGFMCPLKPSMVIEMALVHRFYIDLIEPLIISEEVDEEKGILRIKNVEENKENKLNEEKINKDQILRIKFFNGELKNQIFVLKPKEKNEVFSIGRDAKNSIQISDSKIDAKCADILFHEIYGWVIRASGIAEQEIQMNFNAENGVCVLAKIYEEIRDGKESQKIKIEAGMLISIGQTVFMLDND